MMWSFGSAHDDNLFEGAPGEVGRGGRLWLAAVALFVGVGLAVVPTSVTAQSSEDGGGEQAESTADDGDGADGDGEEADLGVDPDADNYWSKVREVYTVQKRPFEKVNRFSATVYGGLIPNNIFERYYPVGLRLNYFILENIGLELAGSYAFQADTPLNGVMQEGGGINADNIRVGDSQVSHTNFGLVWSPFYGKSAFYDEDIGYFDLFLMGGVGLAITETVPEINAEPERSPKVEGVLGAGLAWYFPDNAAVRVDYRQFVFQKVNPPGGVANPSEISLGVSWFF